ncbi:hypothetical protein E4Q23_07840 [Candidatus Accumulibacter phosphatis]|uniref:Uncharacterized protein n=1 Tax=Candidatus Accumulibacter phosphatis TaxID=327160 RepID=A0ABX1TTU0_9PROT|nr:hypothetical protein [Candidatus Accumulibacter phosphatis]NMQ27672.1 hypothetical protein [Candidatus Accumulibacter phosphatis]
MTRSSEAAIATAIESVVPDAGHKWVDGKGFDRHRGILPVEAPGFMRTAQARLREKLEALHGEQRYAFQRYLELLLS